MYTYQKLEWRLCPPKTNAGGRSYKQRTSMYHVQQTENHSWWYGIICMSIIPSVKASTCQISWGTYWHTQLHEWDLLKHSRTRKIKTCVVGGVGSTTFQTSPAGFVKWSLSTIARTANSCPSNFFLWAAIPLSKVWQYHWNISRSWKISTVCKYKTHSRTTVN